VHVHDHLLAARSLRGRLPAVGIGQRELRCLVARLQPAPPCSLLRIDEAPRRLPYRRRGAAHRRPPGGARATRPTVRRSPPTVRRYPPSSSAMTDARARSARPRRLIASITAGLISA